jgi:hypothetical protein
LRAIANPVSGIDIAPTLLDAVGLPAAPDMEGRSLYQLIETGRDADPRPILGETGLWFTAANGAPFQSQRYVYPDASQFCEIDKSDGSQIVVQGNYLPLLVTAKYRCIISAGKKLIYKPMPEHVRWELYDLATDSLEKNPLPTEEPSAKALKSELLNSFASKGKLVIYQDRVIYDPILAY